MDIQEIIKHHQIKLDYNIEQNNTLKGIPNSMKTGDYKATYDKMVRKYRKRIKTHREIIETLRSVQDE